MPLDQVVSQAENSSNIEMLIRAYYTVMKRRERERARIDNAIPLPVSSGPSTMERESEESLADEIDQQQVAIPVQEWFCDCGNGIWTGARTETRIGY
jgi:hypothetical protein